MTRYTLARVSAGLPMPGLIQVEQPAAFGRIIEDLLLLVEGSLEGEWEGQILYLPLS